MTYHLLLSSPKIPNLSTFLIEIHQNPNWQFTITSQLSLSLSNYFSLSPFFVKPVHLSATYQLSIVQNSYQNTFLHPSHVASLTSSPNFILPADLKASFTKSHLQQISDSQNEEEKSFTPIIQNDKVTAAPMREAEWGRNQEKQSHFLCILQNPFNHTGSQFYG